MSKQILRQLKTDAPQGRNAVPEFSKISNNSWQLANNYSNPISKPQAANNSNVFDISSGQQISLGDLNQVDPSLFDTSKLSLAPGQEPSIVPTF